MVSKKLHVSWFPIDSSGAVVSHRNRRQVSSPSVLPFQDMPAKHPGPEPGTPILCRKCSWPAPLCNIGGWELGRGQLGWIKLDQVQDFWKVSCEVKLNIFHNAVAWGTLIFSTADFFGSGDEDVVSVSNRLSNGCPSLGFQKGWPFKSLRSCRPLRNDVSLPPTRFLLSFVSFCSELSLQPIGSWVKKLIPNIQQASMDPILSDFIP